MVGFHVHVAAGVEGLQGRQATGDRLGKTEGRQFVCVGGILRQDP